MTKGKPDLLHYLIQDDKLYILIAHSNPLLWIEVYTQTSNEGNILGKEIYVYWSWRDVILLAQGLLVFHRLVTVVFIVP